MDSEYRIAMFGPKNAGKTVYLTTLYTHGGNDSLQADAPPTHVFASDDPADGTHDYLSKSYHELRNGLWPDGTPFEKLKAVRFRITSNGTESRINIPDVAGEVTHRTSPNNDVDSNIESSEGTAPEFDVAETKAGPTPQKLALKKQILDEFSTFDGFLIFAPADDTIKGKTLEYKWEVDALLEALKERSAEDRMIGRPIAVVLSKWDVAEQLKDSKSEQSVLPRDFLNANYLETVNALEATCKNWKVFPVSSTGPTLNDAPPEELQPSGMAAPIAWLLRTADQTSLERAHAFEQKHANVLFSKVNRGSKETYLQKAMVRYRDILQKSPPTEIRTAAENSIRELNQRATRRFQKICLCAVGVALVFIISTWSLWDLYVYRQATKDLNDANFTLESLDPAIQSARSFCDSDWHWLAGIYGCKTSLQTTADDKEGKWKAKWGSKLQKTKYETADTAKTLIADCKKFENRFSEPSDGPVVECRVAAENWLSNLTGTQIAAKLLERDKQQLNLEQLEKWIVDAKTYVGNDKYRNNPAFNDVFNSLGKREKDLADRRSETGWLEFQKDYSELSEQPWQQYLTAKSWFAKNSETSHKDAVQLNITEALEKADDQAWNAVQQYKVSNRTNYPKVIEKLNAYLGNPEFKRHVELVRKSLKSAYNSWDKQLYKLITDEADGVLDGNQLAKIKLRCDAYLESTDRPVAMRDAVQEWLRWHRKLREKNTIMVTVESVIVKRKSKWHGYLYYPDVFVTVKVGDKTHKSGSKELRLDIETRGFPKKDLGPFVWSHGKKDIQVSITCTDFFAETLRAKLIEDETFMLRHLNGTVDFDGGKIRVKLKCTAAIPPRFPAYQSVR